MTLSRQIEASDVELALGFTPASAVTVGGTTTIGPASGSYQFSGLDGSVQFQTGYTASAAEWVMAVGGQAGAGASLIARNASETGNVSLNFTVQGTGRFSLSNGSGRLFATLDPGGVVSSGGEVQFTPSTANGPVKIGNANYGVNIDVGTAGVFLIGGLPLVFDFTGYIANNWYVPFGPQNAFAAGAAPGANSIRLYPALIKQKMTMIAMGVRVTTASAGGNAQVAVYAHNPATGRPTGAALITSVNLDTSSLANSVGTAFGQLAPGFYWFATNSDNGTSAYASLGSDPYMSQLIGSTTQQNSIAGSNFLTGLSVSQTFGTWPDLTSATFTEVTTATIPVLQFKVGSVP